MATGRIPDPNSAPITAKGDLYTYSTVPARLAVGANGTTLVADSAETTGLKWATPTAAGTTLISRTAFSGSTSAIFDSVFTSTYDSYMIIIEDVIAVTNTDDLLFQFRVGASTKSTAYYGSSGLLAQSINTWTNFTSSNASSVTIAVDMGTTTNIRTSCTIFVNNVGQTSERASFRGQSFNGSNANLQIFSAGNDATETYTGFVISAGSNITGTAAIYGMSK